MRRVPTIEPSSMYDRMRKRWMEHEVRQRIVGFLVIFEDSIYVLLSLIFFVTALYIMGATIWTFDFRSMNNLIDNTLDRFLVVLMLAELLHTLLLFVKTHNFRHQPFLIVGIIAAIRRILVITAKETTNVAHPHMSGYILDLSVTTAVVVALTVALRISPTGDEF